jgi:hypothetical protein
VSSQFWARQAAPFPIPCALDKIDGRTWLTKFNDVGRNIYVFVAQGSDAAARTRRALNRVVNSLRFTPAAVPVVTESFGGNLSDGRPWTIRFESAGRGLCAVVEGVDHGCDADHRVNDVKAPVRALTGTAGGVLAFGHFIAGITRAAAQYLDGVTSDEGIIVSPSGNFWALAPEKTNNLIGYLLIGGSSTLPGTIVSIP